MPPRQIIIHASPFLWSTFACLTLCVAAGSVRAAEIAVPGTTLIYKTYIEGEGGYDSNPDNLFNHVSTPFEKVEGGFRVKSETATETYELSLKGREVQFNDLDIESRWDYKAAIDTSYILDVGRKLSVGTYYIRDFFALDRLDILQSYAEYAVVGDDYRVKLETRSRIEHNIGGESPQAQQTIDDFNVSSGDAFDYARTDGRVSAIVSTNGLLQPFAIYDFGDINYYNQVSGASINRDAREHFAIAGLRFEPDKTFRFDLGGRYTHRAFDDKDLKQFGRGFIDINAFWHPIDTFTATLVVERFTKEPSTSFGLADDVRTVGLTMDWRLASQWRLNAGGYYDRVNAIGDDFKYNKYTATASLTYEPTSAIEIFLSGLSKWVSEEVSDDEYTRYKIGSGVRFKF